MADMELPVAVAAVLGPQMIFEIPVAFSDNDDSSLSEEDEYAMLILFRSRKLRKPSRIENYIEHTVRGYSKQKFQENFRLTIEAYERLLALVGPYLQRQGRTGRSTINVEKQLLSVIWLLATPDSYRSVGEKFDMSKSSLSTCFTRVITILNRCGPGVIQWPANEEMVNVKRQFQNIAQMPDCIGAVDGTYVPIKAPKEDPQSYITRKCNYAFTLQGIALPSLKFTDTFIGYPGSVSDIRIFRNSDIYNALRGEQNRFCPDDAYIIGDKAYPVLEWCIPPYINRGNLNPAQNYFNTVHAKTRQVVERSFALLFGRFRRLKFLDMNVTALIPATVIAATVMHNICLDFPDVHIAEYIEAGRGHVVENNDDNQGNEIAMEGRRRRDRLCRQIYADRRQMR